MLLKSCLYFILIVLSLLSVPILIYSIKNKRNRKIVKIINLFYIIYLLIGIFILPNILELDIGFEMLFLAFIAIIAVICYIISMIVCFQKSKKPKETTPLSTKKLLVTLLFVILPVLLFAGSLLKEYYLITNSDLILVYKSKGNGGLGDSHTFAYAINEKHCEETSLGISLGNYSLVRYLPKKTQKINNVNNISDYNITLDENHHYILVYKNNKLIHKKRLNSLYFNISFDGGFYINN